MIQKREFHCQVGERISRLRIERKHTREKLSEKVGISDRFLYDIESGRKGCSAENILGIARALGTSTDYLLTGETDFVWDKFSGLLRLLSELPPDSLTCAQKLLADFAEYAATKTEFPQSKSRR